MPTFQTATLIIGLNLLSFTIAQADPQSALLIVHNDMEPIETDWMVLERLETEHGLSVELAHHSHVDSSWAEGMDLIYISSTVSSGTINNKMKNVPVPVLIIEFAALDDMGMSLDDNAYKSESTFQRDIFIEAPDHYLAAGFTGDVVIFDNYEIKGMQGLPNENGTVIANFVEWDAGELSCTGAMFCYEKDAIMADGTPAPERRLFMGLHNDGFANLSVEGEIMWDNAVNWCLYKDVESAVDSNGETPRDFNLAQNYPNPFNPTTDIAFTLEKATDAHLAIYDLQGRVVKELVNSHLQAGNHVYTFDARNLASGLYVYSLTVDGSSVNKKMTLLR